MHDIVLKIEAQLKTVPADKLKSADGHARFTASEHFDAQTVQSQAFAMGRISMETAQFLYQTLGGSAESFNAQPLAARLVCMQALAEIAGQRVYR